MFIRKDTKIPPHIKSKLTISKVKPKVDEEQLRKLRELMERKYPQHTAEPNSLRQREDNL